MSVQVASAQQSARDLAETLLEQSGAPALTVALWQDGSADIAALGERALGSGIAVEPSDRWHVASNTKAMTATLIARLVEDGVVSWDDTIGSVLGPVIEGIDPAYLETSYHDLLTHRAGLRANIGRLGAMRLSGMAADRDLPADRLFYASSVLASAPEAQAPYPFTYSNAGYTIAAKMLEVTTGDAWESLIARHVFAPLGIENWGNGPPGHAGAIDQPRGHKPRLFGGLKPLEPAPGADNIPALGPSGTVHISMADFVKFLAAHATRDPALLRPESWDILHSPRAGEDYAMGWSVQDGLIFHNGSNTFWYSIAGFNPETGAVAAFVANAGTDAVKEALNAALKAQLGGT